MPTVYLFWDADDFGLVGEGEVKAVYASLEDARAQAEHDQALGRHPRRIEDATTGEVLWTPDT